MFGRRKQANKPYRSAFPSPESLQKCQQTAARLLEEANILGALSDGYVVGLFEHLAACPWDRHLYQLLNDALQPYRFRNAEDPDPFRPYPDDSEIGQGDIDLGIVRDTGVAWRINSQDLQHIVLSGPTGGGKTNVVKVLIANLSRVLPLLMITPKNDMGPLLVDPAVLDGCFLFEELKLSLWAPPLGENPEPWHHAVIDLFCRVFSLELSRSHIIEACRELRQSYMAYSKIIGAETWFTPAALLKKIRSQRGKYSESLIAAIEILCAESYGVFEHAQGYPPEALFVNRSTVVSTGAITHEKVGRFVVEWLLEWLHTYYRLNGPYDGSPQFVLILDDAHQHLSIANES